MSSRNCLTFSCSTGGSALMAGWLGTMPKLPAPKPEFSELSLVNTASAMRGS
ncbi:hypothetical protein ACFQ9X_57250 [Catenulispora yoronensis]